MKQIIANNATNRDIRHHAARWRANINLKREFPTLTNYMVNIPPGGRTDALVQANITWLYKGHTIKTRGLDADQIEAAIQATVKMLNIIENL